MRIYENKIRISNIDDLPRSTQQQVLTACGKARKNGHCTYADGTVFSISTSEVRNSGKIRVTGYDGERQLQVLLRAELATKTRRWRIYFGIDHETKPHPGFVYDDFLPAARLDPRLTGYQSLIPMGKVTPRRLYIVSDADPEHVQTASFEMSDIEKAWSVLLKPRFVTVQTDGGVEVVSNIIREERLITMGSALVAQKGSLEELYTTV